jgi:tetratricopeptide (TPR) repeat protein
MPPTKEKKRTKLELNVALASALVPIRGFSTGDVKKSHAYIHILAKNQNDYVLKFYALRVLCAYYLFRCNIPRLHSSAKLLFETAHSLNEKRYLTEAHHVMGVTQFHTGSHEIAHGHFEKVIDLYEPDIGRWAARSFAYDPGVSSLNYDSINLCYFNDFDAGIKRSEAAIKTAQIIDHPFNIAYAFYQHAFIRKMHNEPELALMWSGKALSLSIEYGLVHHQAWSNTIGGWAQAMLGAPHEGIERIYKGIEQEKAIGTICSQQIHLGLLADAYFNLGKFNMANSAVNQALTIISRRGEKWGKKELEQMKELLQNSKTTLLPGQAG